MISNKYTLSLLMAISLNVSTIPAISMEESNKIEDAKTLLNLTVAPRIFTNPKEAVEYTASLFNLCGIQKYDEAFAKAFPEPILKPEVVLVGEHKIATGFAIGDLEQFYFFRLCALSTIYIHFAKKEQLNPKEAVQHYISSLEYINKYLSSPQFGPSFVSNHASVNNIANRHRVLAYEKKAEASYQWACLLIKPEMSNFEKTLPKALLVTSVDCLKTAINYVEISPPLNLQDNLKNTLPDLKFALFNSLITLFNLDVCSQIEQIEFLKSAKAIHQEFQKTNHTYYKAKTSESLKFLTLKKERDTSLVKISSGGSKKINEYKKKKMNELTINLNNLKETVTSDSDTDYKLPLKTKITHDHQTLFFLAQKNLQDPTVIPLLRKIEDQIREELMSLTTEPTLFDIYQKYEVFLGGNTLREHIQTHILPALLSSGDIEGALELVMILSQLEYQKLGNNSFMTTCLRAAIKNLNGDHEEWEAFEQKMTSTWENIKKAKEATKKQKEEKYTELMRNREIRPASKLNNYNRSKEEVKPQYLDNKVITSASQENNQEELSSRLDSISLKEEKEEKRKRHEEAEKRREVEKNQPDSIPLDEKKPQHVISIISEPSLMGVQSTIKDLYHLEATAKKVDAEIENNTWTFTRKDLMTYFENLGCAAIEGGKHKKVSLPRADFILYKGETIAIMNDLGGALTLPRWDGSDGNGQVPFYLRKQILKAREKLVLLKMKAHNTISNTITNYPK